MTIMKLCNRCESSFSPTTHRQFYCTPDCTKAGRLERARDYKRSQVKDPNAVRRTNNLRRYGITSEQWEVMFEEQGRRCANPGCLSDVPNGKNWHTDHDHATGIVRGILCGSCNLMLGHAKDDITRLEGAVAYLLDHESATNLTKGDV